MIIPLFNKKAQAAAARSPILGRVVSAAARGGRKLKDKGFSKIKHHTEHLVPGYQGRVNRERAEENIRLQQLQEQLERAQSTGMTDSAERYQAKIDEHQQQMAANEAARQTHPKGIPGAGKASTGISAVTGVGGFLLGAASSHLSSAEGERPGGRHIIVAIIVWLAGMGLSIGGQGNSMLGVEIAATIFFIASLHYNRLLILVAALEIGSAFQTGPFLTRIDILNNVFFNPFMPWWPLYMVMKNGGQGPLLIRLLYIITAVLLLGFVVEKTTDATIEPFGLDVYRNAVSEEQVKTARGIWTTAFDGVRHGLQSIGTGVNNGLAGLLNPRIAAAGGTELFGEPKETPKIGLVIKQHDRPVTIRKLPDNSKITTVKAILTLPNLPDQDFLNITDIECSVDDSNEKLPDEFNNFTGGVKLFFNTPMTVSCTYSEDALGDSSNVDIAVRYRFEENAKLITYFMRADLLEQLYSKGKNPLDYMAVPSSNRFPSTVYDNGPARVGIGPAELLDPPLGIGGNKLYPEFELVIGNKKSFDGEISRINEINVITPPGVKLKDKTLAPGEIIPCFVHQDVDNRKYVTDLEKDDYLEESVTEISSKRLFTCDMEIDSAHALSGASFAEVEYDVTIDFTYETTTSISLDAK